MAKAKKDTNQKSNKVDAVRVPDDANQETVDEKSSKPVKKPKMADKKPAKKVDKVSKPKPKNPTIAIMVQNALNNLKSRQGCSLPAIRKFIATNYDLEMNKQRQNLIKTFLKSEFDGGRLKMTNFDNPTIDFSKRFNISKKYED